MTDDIQTLPESPATAPERVEQAIHRPRQSLGWLALLLAVIACVLAAWGLWRTQIETRAVDGADKQLRTLRETMDTELALLKSQLTALRGRLDGLRSETDDRARGDSVLREQVLAIAERADTLERALARFDNLREDATARLQVSDAERLLVQGIERLRLGGDRSAAIEAARLADAALARSEDVRYAGVRADIQSARQALERSPGLDSPAVLARLAALESRIAALPRDRVSAPAPVAQATEEPGLLGRVGAVLSRFVSVRRSSPDGFAEPQLEALAKARINQRVRLAELAVIARDPAAFTHALDGLARELDALKAGPQAVDVLGEIEQLRALRLEYDDAPLRLALDNLRSLQATARMAEGPELESAP